MDSKYATEASNFLTEGGISVDNIVLGIESSPDGDITPFDMSSYVNYEGSTWISFEDRTTSPSYNSQDEYSAERASSSSPKATCFKSKDPEISRLNRRRAQNRQSQKQFRERKQKAYDEVVAQLRRRDHVISSLRSEIAILNLTVVGLQREKQNCLEAVVRLCQSMYEQPETVKFRKEV